MGDSAGDPPAMTYRAPGAIRDMLFATWSLMNSFTADQRGRALFPLDDPRRVDWDFIPKPDRTGIPLFELDRHQKALAHTLLRAGLSLRGYSQAVAIMATENILRELEVVQRGFGVYAADFRDPEAYLLSWFGRPAFEDTWGWRIMGHHLGFNVTVIGQERLTVTPLAMGAQPFPAGVLNPLGESQAMAFELLHRLSADQRRDAHIHPVAPADFATRQVPRVGAVELPDHVDLGIETYAITDEDRWALRFERRAPSGLNGSRMSADDLALARELLLHFVETAPDELAAQYRRVVESEPAERLTFAWAGGTRADTAYYFRVSTGGLLVESDNAVAAGQHVHAVWRDLDNDLGHDLLLAHYARNDHRRGSAHLHRRITSSTDSDADFIARMSGR
ncbi:DUF3500 domain-containing protein [Mangrovihabitans endophyticus]|uniref:DUF3500 domain-containing protein n=1 Tax=Mangrovihabitans endophyticus TaxID=1751298 RepID=A0A8J3BTD6_9ACTN|nr:DUF3500 domain-containing protein [Mangrovihabitans endophyticus]GGK75882.1 hypothetical protein GCM10012284_07340 [Mangrovihabitans endophyticus]